MLTPPILSDAKRREKRAFKVMTSSLAPCMMSMSWKMYPRVLTAPEGWKY